MKPEYSIVIPAYNAAKTIALCVSLVKKELNKLNKKFEIIIAEDGSTDGTTEIAETLAKKSESIIHLHNDKKLGRGKALSNSIKKSKGKYIIYIDVDLDISPLYLKDFIENFNKGEKIVVASKRHPLARANSPLIRKTLSKMYNNLVRLILNSKVYGHQGGMKGFKKDIIMKILPYVKDNKWFWDTEILVIAQWLGYKAKEIPITCDYGFEGTTVSSLKDSYIMFKRIFELKKRKSSITRNHSF